jgi:hypothetical protein
MFSKIIRRSHMYLALFLMPWVLMYALSTMAMNHREFFRKVYGGKPAQFEKEREQTYTGLLAANATPSQAAVQILRDLNQDGTFSVQGRPDGERLTIFRQDPVIPRRITYTPKDGRLVIERQIFQAPAFLERMHRRRGFQHDYLLEDTWASSVDLVIIAMVFWGLSGLWMWWELRATRGWGLVCLLTGATLFGVFLFVI